MRQMARNLKNMRKIAVSQGKAELAGAPLESFITPQCFEIVVEASLMSSAGVEGEWFGLLGFNASATARVISRR